MYVHCRSRRRDFVASKPKGVGIRSVQRAFRDGRGNATISNSGVRNPLSPGDRANLSSRVI